MRSCGKNVLSSAGWCGPSSGRRGTRPWPAPPGAERCWSAASAPLRSARRGPRARGGPAVSICEHKTKGHHLNQSSSKFYCARIGLALPSDEPRKLRPHARLPFLDERLTTERGHPKTHISKQKCFRTFELATFRSAVNQQLANIKTPLETGLRPLHRDGALLASNLFFLGAAEDKPRN